MIKEFLESLKLKDIVFFVLIIVLFCMYFKKNKKEKFSLDLSTTDKLKEQMAIALGDNFTAIKNLGDLAAQITSSSTPGELTLNKLTINDGTTDFNILETIKTIQNTNINQGSGILAAQRKANAAQTRADYAYNFANQNRGIFKDYVKYGDELSFWNKANQNNVLHMDDLANGVYRNKTKCYQSRCINIIKRPTTTEY